MAQGLVMLGALVAAAPAIWLALQAVASDTVDALPALWVGIGVGVAVFAFGIAIGSAVFERRSTR
ncbi:hypothetical protein, partial [Acinetobacter sp. LH3_13]|uniref:hypothetical protein n=1 Tax=Acinetobacter sp. LH3_13 TaxID=3434463 RepID=UPI003EBDE6FA